MLAKSYPIRQVCQVLGMAVSSYYYTAVECDKSQLKAALQRLAGQWPTYGRPRLTAMLKREGWPVNHKRVARLMDELGITAERPPRRQRTTNSEHDFPRYSNLVSDLAIVSPDQVWVADITYIHLQQDFVYLAVLMDVFTRAIRGWQLSRSLDRSLTLSALQRALQTTTPQYHHSDQGVQYACHDYVTLLHNNQVQISMAAVGTPTENGYAERLMRTIKEEHVDLTDYLDFSDAYRQIARFLNHVYQRKRIHAALGYLTPTEFEQQWRSSKYHTQERS